MLQGSVPVNEVLNKPRGKKRMSDFTNQLAEVSEFQKKAKQIEQAAKQPVIDQLAKHMRSLNDVTNPDVNARCGELESGGRDLIAFICDTLDIDVADLNASIDGDAQ